MYVTLKTGVNGKENIAVLKLPFIRIKPRKYTQGKPENSGTMFIIFFLDYE